ncbi:MAG: M20/M25/M40 family metallo-hydrolase [Campylobacteraceae bacterium]|jgi:dipeptidase D|nr:M20/M25/M40 family metallo-hydrolase [Campylobacteraceae bacterium]
MDTIEIFKSFAKVPRCSFEASKMRDFIVSFAASCGYEAKIDKADNILCQNKKPLLCLQSHYDMVCLGDAPNVEMYEKEGWIRAKNSTLGADNGIGVALMLNMMQKFDDIELLFTSDEEVGLIGANSLEHQLTARYLLNLDSEQEGVIVIGCAGGAEISGCMKIQRESAKSNFKTYEISIKDLDGGHSGLDIDKNIPNAIKILADELKSAQCDIVSINGGERINSIPKAAKAVIYASKEIKFKNSALHVKEIEYESAVLTDSKKIIDALASFKQGVRSYNDKLKMTESSINLSTIKTDANSAQVDFFARSMNKNELKYLCQETVDFLNSFGFKAEIKNCSLPWQPTITPFAKKVQKAALKFFDNVPFQAVHAGLECGIFENKNHFLQTVSIGPNIHFPHSLRERCDIASVERLEQITEEIILELRRK